MQQRILQRGMAVGLLAAFGLVPLLAARLDPRGYAGGRSRDAGQRLARNTSAIGIVFGEFRTSMSDIMYIKTERYLDTGVAYRPHVDTRLSTEDTVRAIEAHQETVEDGAPAGHGHHDHAHDEHGACVHAGHDHGGSEGGGEYAGTPTIIPERQRDYRGFLGDLHRAVQPWRDPALGHRHTDGRELLPWFRLITLSDPHYVRGYTVGSWWLKRRNLKAAFEFVEEGIRHNPDAFQIHLMRGLILIERARSLTEDIYDPSPAALEPIQAARRSFITSAELAIKQRPPDYDEARTDPGVWSYYDENDAAAACHMVVLTEQRYGDRERAAVIAGRYAAYLPDDPVLQRLATAGGR